jgi:hypothetical protein
LSCTKELEIDIPSQNPRLVVYSTIVPFSLPLPKTLTIDVQSSNHIFDTTKEKINDALVLYYENDFLKDTLKFEENGYKIGESISDYPIVGNSYGIKVVKEGYETIIANTTIPSKVEITDTVLTPIAYLDETGAPYSEIAVTFMDPAEEINFYEIAVSEISYSYDNPDNFYELSTNDPIITSESYYPSLVSVNINQPKYLLFSDKTINGKEHTLHIYYSPPLHEIDYKFIVGHYINVHLRNVTEDYYKFKTTMIQQINNKKEDILYGTGEPLNVISNTKNGYGLFAGFNHDVVSMHVDGKIKVD